MSPPYAILIWSDDRNIYCEFCASPDKVVTFPNTTVGLAKALALLGAERKSEAKEIYVPPPYLPKELEKQGLNAADIAKARAVLQEIGVLK